MIRFLLYFREVKLILLFGEGQGAEKEYMHGNIEYEKPLHSLSSLNECGYIENNLPSPGGRGLRGGGIKSFESPSPVKGEGLYWIFLVLG